MKKIVVSVCVFIAIFFNECMAESNVINVEDIISSQSKSLDISTFIKEAESFQTEVLDEENISNILSEAIAGKVNTSNIGKRILNLFFKEVIASIASIASIIVIVIIHSILKSISDGLKDTSTSQITYYVTYVLIVAVIMKNFADIITLIKTSIEDLIGFANCLLPILMSLMVATRKYYFCNSFTTHYFTCYYNNRKYNYKNNYTVFFNIVST